MGEPASSPAEPTVNVRVAIRCATIEAFVDKYWRLVDGDRIFIFSATPQAAGTRIRFNLVLSDGTELIKGEGRVIRSRQEASDPSRPPGMDVRFVAVDESSRNLVEFLHATRMEQAAKVLQREDSVPITVVDMPRPPVETAPPPPPPPEPKAAPPPPPEPKVEVAVEKPAVVVEKTPAPEKVRAVEKTPPPEKLEKAEKLEKTPAPEKVAEGETPRPSFAREAKRTSAAELLASRWSAPAMPAPTFAPAPPAPPKEPPAEKKEPLAEKRATVSPSEKPASTEPSIVIEDDDGPLPDPAPIKAAPEPVPAKAMVPEPPKAEAPAPKPAPPPSAPRLPPPPPATPADLNRLIDSALTEGVPPDAPELPLMASGEKVRFAEQWRKSQPRIEAVQSGTVPANPFANVNDEAIEFFVEWSLEQSKGEPTVDHARYADVPMTWGTPPSEKRTGPLAIIDAPPSRKWLPYAIAAGGLIIGLGVGIPVGAKLLASKPPAEVIVVRPPPAPVVEDLPPPTPVAKDPTPAVANDPAPPEPKLAAVPKKDPKPAPVAEDPPPADNAPDPSKGTLLITSLPLGASVVLDGKDVGTTPLTRVVAPGSHKVALEKERYNSINRGVSVAAGGKATVEVVLQRPMTSLAITSEPAGAKVTLNKSLVGKAPLKLNRPAFEHYALHAELPGCKLPVDRSLYLKPDDPPVSLRCARR